MTLPLRFFLNDEEVCLDENPGTLVLDVLRTGRQLTGTKEGCREGDCGACAVLVGTLEGDTVRYLSVTSCLMPAAELAGRHLVTIEGLSIGESTPVQVAIDDEGGSQCGFCTPGIVVSLTGMLITEMGNVDLETTKNALGGHLCRCTGYRSLKATWKHLAAASRGARSIDDLVNRGLLPAYFAEVPDWLRAVETETTTLSSDVHLMVGGGTDVYVQQGDEVAGGDLIALNNLTGLSGVADRDGYVEVGAMTTFEDFAASPAIRRVIPSIGEYMALIASVQIRNRATVGGNIVNASPIGDLSILLLAMECELVLRNRNGDVRTIPIRQFFRGYKDIDLRSGEMLTEIRIPRVDGARIGWEKVSKRKYLDIATVNSAISISAPGSTIERASIAVGGVAPIPLFLAETSAFLQDKPVNCDTVLQAAQVALDEITPISDVRGSADYKRLLTRQLLFGHFATLFPETITVEALCEAY